MHEVIFLHFVLQRFELDHHFLPRLFEPFEAEDFFIERWHGQDGATFGAKVFDRLPQLGEPFATASQRLFEGL